jgi:hypothetical protein
LLKKLKLGALVTVGSEDEVRKWIECWSYWQTVQDKVGLEIEWGEAGRWLGSEDVSRELLAWSS